MVPFTTAEGLKAARIMMVLSSLSPVFALWAIRGKCCIPDYHVIPYCDYFVPICVTMAVAPLGFLIWWRHSAVKDVDKQELATGETKDNRSHVLVYLFAVLLSFFQAEFTSERELLAILIALACIAFLFFRMNLHYTNLYFALLGYRIYTVFPPEDGNPFTGKEPFILITKRRFLMTGERLTGFRLSDTVFLETTYEARV